MIQPAPGKRVVVQRQSKLKSLFTRTFGSDIQNKQKKQAPLSNEEIAQRYAILQAALKEAAAKEKGTAQVMKVTGATKEEARALVNSVGVGENYLLDVPEDFRPRRVTLAEKQVKRNRAARLEERVRDYAAEQRRKQAKVLEPEEFSKETGRQPKAGMAAAHTDPEKVKVLQEELAQVDKNFVPLVKAALPKEKEVDSGDAAAASEALTKVAYLPTIGDYAATGSGKIAGLAGNKTVAGVSTTDPTTGQKIIKQVGTAQQGGDLQSTATDLLSLGSTISSLIGAVQERESYHAGQTQEARRDWMLAEPGSAEKLLADDPFHVAQTLIILGRDGNADALGQLKLYGIDAGMLASSKDDHLRSLILSQAEESQDPKTVTQKVMAPGRETTRHCRVRDARQLRHAQRRLRTQLRRRGHSLPHQSASAGRPG